MSLLERFTRIFQKEHREDDSKGKIWQFFHPNSPSEIRRLQFFWATFILTLSVGLVYLVMQAFVENHSKVSFESEEKPIPKSMETASSKVDLHEGYYHKVEEENRKLNERLNGLEVMFQEGVKSHEDELRDEGSSRVEELESRVSELQRQLEDRANSSFESESLSPQQNSDGESQGAIIQKFSLSLHETDTNKKLKTIETTIPAGAFAKTVLLSGLDASASMNASSDPRPMLLRLVFPGTLPRRFQSDLKDCHCTASAYGDLSSERVYARLEKLTCIERASGEIIETQVAGYIAGSDGKAGIRGIVASKDGKFLGRSLMGGIFAGLSNVANPQNRQSQVNPFFPGSSQVSPPSIGETFTSGMASGATSALDRLSQYYIDRAEQLQPVIQIAAGQVVDIVFTEGIAFGSDRLSVNSNQKKERE